MKRGRLEVLDEECEGDMDECEAVTITGHGNLCERRTRRAPAGVGGSVAGWESVWEGMAECMLRSSTVRAEGVKETSYVIGARCRRVWARSGCMCKVVLRVCCRSDVCEDDLPREPSVYGWFPKRSGFR